MKKSAYFGTTALALAALSQFPAIAQDTVTYTYDALGRLVATSTTGGPNGGTSVGTCFDRAGNRTRYDVRTPSPAPTPTPTPCPTPTP